jgi:hypothetical protein
LLTSTFGMKDSYGNKRFDNDRSASDQRATCLLTTFDDPRNRCRYRRSWWRGAGGIIGSAVGRPGAGAAIGGALGLGAGTLIGDQIQALQQRQVDLEKQLQSSQTELENQRKELERLKKQAKEY